MKLAEMNVQSIAIYALGIGAILMIFTGSSATDIGRIALGLGLAVLIIIFLLKKYQE